MRFIGFVGEPTVAPQAGPHLGLYAEIGDVVRRHRPDRILIAMPDRRGNLPVAELLACRFRGVVIEDGTLAYERLTRRLAVESLTPSALIFGDGFRVSLLQQVLQRIVSVVVSAIGLVVTAPLMVVIAIVTKLESPGPVLFVQERIGLGGRPFRVFKFRTMRPEAPDQDGVWGRDNASRVTRFGEKLRRYRLDELPQFWNILRGDMSLVGPRPEMASNVATLAAVIPFYNLRHEVRPGLTGWAQVKAGYSMSTEEVTRKLCYDLYYIKHMSVAFDLRILFDTVKFVLCGKRPG
jgi:exopolysaccharide biosynthesis polyprenyl glycosylphosphotransferase